MHPFRQPSFLDDHPFRQPEAEPNTDLIEQDQTGMEMASARKAEKKKILAREGAHEEVEEEKEKSRTLQLTNAADVLPMQHKWLWRERIPLGEVTMIVGKGGIGKSQILAMLAAWITTGNMKGEYFGQPRNLVYVVNEDDLNRTVVPRLMAAGADLSRVYFAHVENQGEIARLDLNRDLDRIGDAADQVAAVAVFFDPLSSNLNVKSISGDEIRPLMEKIRKMAESRRLSVVGLGHVRKGHSKDLLEALMGSSELGNVLRSAMGVMKQEDDPEGAVVLSQEKNNNGRADIHGYRYKIVEHVMFLDETITTSRLSFLGKTDLKVGDMMNEAAAQGVVAKSALSEAVDFLKHYLIEQGGEALRGDVIKHAQADGHTRPTVDRAARALQLESVRMGSGPAKVWRLPVAVQTQPDG